MPLAFCYINKSRLIHLLGHILFLPFLFLSTFYTVDSCNSISWWVFFIFFLLSINISPYQELFIFRNSFIFIIAHFIIKGVDHNASHVLLSVGLSDSNALVETCVPKTLLIFIFPWDKLFTIALESQMTWTFSRLSVVIKLQFIFKKVWIYPSQHWVLTF